MLGKPFSEVLSKGSRKKWGKILKEIRKAKVPTKSDVYLDFLVDSQLVISRCCNLFLPKNSQQIHVNGGSHSLYSSIEKMHANKKEGGSTFDKELDLYVTRLYNHIQNNARLKNPDKTILHKDLGIKPVKLRHAFSQKYGLTVNKFILKERLKLARTELLKSKKGIKHVALECGFKNVSHFYFAFKAEFHMTPSELRKLGKP